MAGNKIYLAARYSRHPEMQTYRAALEALGYVVTSRWINGDHMMAEEGSPEAKHDERIRFAREDMDDLMAADIVIAFAEEPRKTTGRGGRHVEFGMALAAGKRVLAASWRENVFFCLPQVEFYPGGFEDIRLALGPSDVKVEQLVETSGLPEHVVRSSWGGGTMTHVMHDLETMGNEPGRVLASLGAVVFDPRGSTLGETFSMNIDEESCLAVGLTLDPETVAWWQAPERAEAYAALKVNPRPLAEVLDAFDAYWSRVDGRRIWGQGADYDAVLLAAAYRALGRKPPWKYNAGRDTRTVYEMGDVTVTKHLGTHHVALDDAITQAGDVQESHRRLWLDQVQGRTRMEVNLETIAEVVRRLIDLSEPEFAGGSHSTIRAMAADLDALLPTAKRVWP